KGHHAWVFLARQKKEDRMVALKVFHPEFPKNEEEAERFIQAMKVRWPLRHPNLVTILAIGRTVPYSWVALELVEGESLAQMIQKFGANGVPEWQEAFRLAVHIGRALHFGIYHHLLHRNITPANILFRSTDHLYKLGDLGLAKALTGSQLRQTVMR